jgi:hypothetical protein
MNTSGNSEEPVQDPLLRREAGEGWRSEGVDEELLGAIAAREFWADRAEEGGVHFPAPGHEFYESYLFNVKRVREIKEAKGIGDPPSLPPEGE